jgi:RNA polymerase sigma factor (sigma-70 family)
MTRPLSATSVPHMDDPPIAPEDRRKYEDLVARAVGCARRFIGPDEAAEVAHDVAVELLKRPEREVSGALLYIAVTYRLRALWRSSDRRSANEREWLEMRGAATPVWAQPDATLEAGELGERIEETLARMPAGMREAFLLVREEELSYKEAAARLGVAVGTVHTHVSRANALLRDCVNRYRADQPRSPKLASRKDSPR